MSEITIDESDFDEETNFRPEVVEQLRHFLEEHPAGEPADDILKELGLSECPSLTTKR